MSSAAESAAKQPAGGSIYNRRFWIAYAANVMLVASNAVTFKFADLVDLLGGSKETTGEIIRFGLYGAVGVRLFLGQAMDRYGIGRVWRIGAILCALGAIGMATAGALDYYLSGSRLVYASGLAVLFSCSMAHIQNEVAPRFRTEVIASLGSSGFIGLMAGTIIADIIARSTDASLFRFEVLFGVTAFFQLVYLTVVTTLTWNDATPSRSIVTPPAWTLLHRYWPGTVILCGLFMGAGYNSTSVYLTQFSEQRGFSGISAFFVAYAISAFIFRVVSRTWSYRFGRYKLTLTGIVAQAIGFACIPLVWVEWALMIPAVIIGFGHALLFPAVVSLGTRRFPKRYRGTGTALTMATFDLGGLVLAPVMGWIIDVAGYPQMYGTTAALAVAVAAIFAVSIRGEVDSDQVTRPAQSKTGLIAGKPVAA